MVSRYLRHAYGGSPQISPSHDHDQLPGSYLNGVRSRSILFPRLTLHNIVRKTRQITFYVVRVRISLNVFFCAAELATWGVGPDVKRDKDKLHSM